ncbi:hypothetical protein, partial [Caldibacillus thermoamylovorans]|uniref:hypothetical protein n=1 Tax=Caldibacillus thermoamylovorans TaxID=35841 RepID=UPI001F46D90C
MGQNALKKRKKCLIGASNAKSMGQNRSKTTKNCPIESRNGTKCIEKEEKVSHRSKQILFYGTKP